jgi:tRNA pseudouridine38-40 synthase
MTRIAIGLEYDGSPFRGWQCQKEGKTVQVSLETALSKVAAHRVKVVAAGRTDAGVHAMSQVIHFDTSASRTDSAWIFGTNTQLPPSVRVIWAKQVEPHFNARRSALSRSYKYVIYNHRIRPGLFHKQVGWYYRKLDIQKMREAVAYWIGEHDFSSFRASECQSRSPVRRISDISMHVQGDMVIIDITANAFLHHMVRNMIGVLFKVGSMQREPEWAQQVLEARDRKAAGMTAPSSGLYLMAVEYPAAFGLPIATEGLWFLNGSMMRNELR